MTTVDLAATAPGGRWPAWTRRVGHIASTDRLVWLAIALLWLLGHAYGGIQHDAHIYMGRAVADLDPGGVGRDMMFELDGQASFSLYRFVARTLVAALGLGPAVGLITVVNLIVWFAAIVCLARVLVPGRAVMLVLLVALALPRFYTPWSLIGAGESVPVPRPLAEAGVLLALAAFQQNRLRLGASSLFGAALLHPIMAAPGFVVLFVLLVRRDRRWLVAAALAMGSIATAAVLGVPVVSRLLVVIDPEWRAILLERNAYLWLRLWPIETYGMIGVQATTIVIACHLVERRAAVLLWSVLLAGAVGVLASLALGDGLSSLLVVQAQLWRALWLPASVAPLAAGICAWRLPARGPAGQIALALLALAWVAMNWTGLGPLAAVAALGCLWLDDRRLVAFSRGSVIATAITCAALIVLVEAVPISTLVEIAWVRPADAPFPWTFIWNTGAMVVPTILLALAWWHFRRTVAARFGAALVVAALACVVVVKWDNRTPFQASTEIGARRPDLQAMLSGRPGDVLWLRGDEVWSWLGQANWNGFLQGGPIVFSRPLAVKWHERSVRLVHHGLETPRLLDPWNETLSKAPADLERADLDGFCRQHDAPIWIITALEKGRQPPNVPGLAVWTPGGVEWSVETDAKGFRWVATDRFSVIPCKASALAG